MWVTVLIISQLGQIAVGYTTNEVINFYRFDYMVHPDDTSAPAYRRRTINPFNAGFFGNCTDFWLNGAGPFKDISWFTLYEVPNFLLDKALKRENYHSVNSEPKSIEDLV
jgi:hypothetical protein